MRPRSLSRFLFYFVNNGCNHLQYYNLNNVILDRLQGLESIRSVLCIPKRYSILDNLLFTNYLLVKSIKDRLD